MGQQAWMLAARAVFMTTAVTLLVGCGGGGYGGTNPPTAYKVPAIANINNSTSPSITINVPNVPNPSIQINGSNFQSAPGQVVFTQGSTIATVVPSTSNWSNTSIVAVVPSGAGMTQFTAPGTLIVTVVTAGGTSNGVTLNLLQPPPANFTLDNVTWTTTTPLPTALAGLRAVGVPGNSSTSAFVVVTGGYDGTKNTTTVLTNILNSGGTVGATWTVAANPLPASRAHHGMVEADPSNSPVAAGSRFVYVIGGQQNLTDTSGTATVLMASVDPATGAVGTWSTLSSNLPQPLVGPAATIFDGYIYVVGGWSTAGSPSASVYSAAVKSDGTLSAWTTSTNPYPTAVSFATVFGSGSNLYVLGGDSQISPDPNSQGGAGINGAKYASALNGVVGTWTATNSTAAARKKQVTWFAFGNVLDAEGVYTPVPLELEQTVVQNDNTLAGFTQISGASNQINANVYNAGAFVSPLLSSAGTPRLLLLGGQAFTPVTPTVPGPLSTAVYVNTAP
jgi:hypothetical protein